MTVNGVAISTYKATLLTKNISPSAFNIYEDWSPNALNPLYLGKQAIYKTINLRFLIQDTTDTAAFTDMSSLINALSKSTIVFTGLSFTYDCTIVSSSRTRVRKGVYNLDVELRGFAYIVNRENILSPFTSRIFTVTGNVSTPAYIQLVGVTVPSITVGITNADGTFYYIISNITSGQTITIDGILGKVLQGTTNKFADTLMTRFPYFTVGSNTITVSSSSYSEYTIYSYDKYV